MKLEPILPSHSRQKRVLIVDDIEDNRVLLHRYLSHGGYTTDLCDSGHAALARISEERPDIVLLDWMMPHFSGLDTLCAIREQYDSIRLPVIMCTALDDEKSVVQAMTAGANDYVTKPISLAILKARMKLHLEQLSVIESLDCAKDEATRKLLDQTRAMFRSLNGDTHGNGPDAK